ncbi:MAG: UDP-N-acetylmuramoyl-tripeptide--D-alanyl-D-alanine ligase [Marinoscillum sp.]|jgi:UDP-N-acetylmuramoyl-tripeptide--D-alanyl-D-alanine ligase
MDNFIEYLYSKFLQSDGVSIDTRTIQPGNLFFAIQGPNFNANEFAKQAIEKGAAFAVVDDAEYVVSDQYILAAEGMKALQDLAIFHRSRFKRKVLGITGSNGKTTTKELVNLVLSKKYITSCTSGNYNNHLGVPLTILDIHPQVEIAIIEMGANHVGDIAELCGYANPNIGLITNIGEAHTELFGGIEGVLRGKTELFDHLKKTGGTAFINSDDERLKHLINRFDQPMTFPSEDLTIVAANPNLEIALGDLKTETQIIGRYNFGNIAAAVALGRYFKVPDRDILDAIASYVPSNQRSQVIKKGDLTIILDCYNANPTSMKAAIDNLASYEGPKHVVLGDMKEVETPEEKHRQVGGWVQSMAPHSAIFVGQQMKWAADQLQDARWFANIEGLKEKLNEMNFKKGTLLIKGSRSMKLEQLKDLL